jgi:hypothetical protein
MDTNPDKPWYLSRGLLQGLVVLAGAFVYCAYELLTSGTRIEVVFLIFIVFLIIAGVGIVFQRLFSPDFFSRLEEQKSSDTSDRQEITKK